MPAHRAMRLMTYNVHRCLGTDGIHSPERIAEVIAEQEPDVVALQELDVYRPRSQGVDQPTRLAQLLEMKHLFCATIVHESERYGIALLSRGSIGLHHEAPLPTADRRRPLEPRSALWGTVEVEQRRIHVINTHLGLDRRERELQVAALMGNDWIERRTDHTPLILCGDFNFASWSRPYRSLLNRLVDAQRAVRGGRPHRTFPSRLPLIRIDYVFLSPGIEVEEVRVPFTPLTRRASDHLPLVVTIRLPDEEMPQ